MQIISGISTGQGQLRGHPKLSDAIVLAVLTASAFGRRTSPLVLHREPGEARNGLAFRHSEDGRSRKSVLQVATAPDLFSRRSGRPLGPSMISSSSVCDCCFQKPFLVLKRLALVLGIRLETKPNEKASGGHTGGLPWRLGWSRSLPFQIRNCAELAAGGATYFGPSARTCLPVWQWYCSQGKRSCLPSSDPNACT